MPEKYLKIIESSKLLESIPKDEIKSLFKNGQIIVKNYKKGSIIHLEGEKCDKIEIILSGNVVIDSLDATGNLLTITDFYSGDILGGNLIFASSPYYPMTITSLTDSAMVQIDKNVLTELFYRSGEFLIAFLKLISDNTSILSSKIKNSINKSIREKIIIYLTYQRKVQKNDTIKLYISKKKLAEKMGVQRTSLSRELTKMKDEGYIDFDKEFIRIIELEK